jgi:hypothetical protein
MQKRGAIYFEIIDNIIIDKGIKINRFPEEIMRVQAGRYHRNIVFGLQSALFFLLLWVVPFNMSGCASTNTIDTANSAPIDIPLLEKWAGDYPVSELGSLPEGQQDLGTGYIGDAESFIPVWRAFMPDEILPAVDFSKNIVVFTRNIQFYNRTSIFKVALQDGTIEILAMETMSAMPIEEKVAMAMAVIPRDGIGAIRTGAEKLEVKIHK